jgi:ribosomal protein S18 acetylase RimI-like enzyme
MLTDAEQAAVDFAAKQYGERAVRPSGVEEVTGRPEGKFTTEVDARGNVRTRELTADESQAATDEAVNAELRKHRAEANDIKVMPQESTISKAPTSQELRESATQTIRKFEAAQHPIEEYTNGSDTFKMHTVTATAPDGKLSGSLRLTEEPESGVVRVGNASVEPEYQNLGIGRRLYDRAIDSAIDRGAKTFNSDGVVSADAQRVWKSLAKDYPVKQIEGKAGTTFSIDLTKVKPEAETSDFPLPKAKARGIRLGRIR